MKRLNDHLSLRFRVLVMTLMGVFMLCITDAYAGTAYSDGRAYLRAGSPQNAGKVYVSTSSSTPAASAYKACNTVQTSETTTPCATAQVKGETTTTTYHFWAVANAGYKFTGWYDSNGALKGSGAEHISASVTSGTAGASDTHAYLDMHASFIKIIQMGFVVPTNGTYDISHAGEAVSNYASITVDGKVVLTAHPADGYKLRGWYTTTNGGVTKNYFAFGSTCEPNFTNNVTIGAEFVPDDGKATFWIKGTNKIFDDLKAANNAASSGNIIVVVSDGVVGAGTYTIKSGVTLLIPYNETYDLMTTPKVVHYTSAGSAPALSAFRRLTLAEGAIINVNGNICIGGQQTAVNGGSPTSQPCGAAGVLDMSRGGTINLNNGSALYAWGFVKGQDMDQGNNTEASGVGEINAADGATVWEDFQCGEWRGGTASSTIYSNKGSWRFFPFQSYSIQNVEVPVNYAYGSTLQCHWAIFGNGSTFTVKFPLVAKNTDSSLFKLASGGTLRKWYDPTTDRVCYELGGGATVDALILNVLGESVSSSDYNLPIPANMHIILKSGNTLTISKPMTAHAGAVVEVKSGATLNINNKVYMYDADDWDTYCMYAYYYRTYKNLTSHYDRGTGTSKANLEDATLIVEGTVNVGAQNLYATAHGASIIGKGGGILKYGTLPDNTTMKQCKKLSDAVTVNIRSANLKNDNESFTQGIASTTFKNVNGRWFTSAKSEEKTNHTYDFTYIKSGDVYGTAGTNGTVAACYSKDKTGLELQNKWANIKAEGCDNWWTGIDDSHLYNYTLNSAWHQYIKTGSTVAEGGEEPIVTYAGSDGKVYQKQGCDIVVDGSMENCLYGTKALVNGSFIAVVKNTEDEAYHKSDAATTYYLCFDGCVWHPATYNAENLYTVDGTKYIWYNNAWLAVTYDDKVKLYYSLSATNVRIYYEYVNHAWVLASPVAEVVTSAGTEQVYSLEDAKTKAKAGGTNVTIRLLKDMKITSAFTYDGANNCSLDLNGFTLKGTVTNMIKINHASATFIIKDQSAAGTGKIEANFSRGAVLYGLEVTQGHLMINSGTVHIENTDASQGACGVVIKTGHKFTMNGGTLEATSKGQSWAVYTESTTTSVITINGGSILASTTSTSVGASGIYSVGGIFTIDGGTLAAKAATLAKGICLTNEKSTLTVNGGTVSVSAIDGATNEKARGISIEDNSATNINGGTIIATATAATAFGIHSSGTTTINGGKIRATAKSDAFGAYCNKNKMVINTTDTIHANATEEVAAGVVTIDATSVLKVNAGTVNVTAPNNAYGLYANHGTDTINGGEFLVSATGSQKPAYGMYLVKNNPKVVVNGGKFKVNASADAYKHINFIASGGAATQMSLAGGYFSKEPNASAELGTGNCIASGKEVKDVESAKEPAIWGAGYRKKIAGTEHTVTWKNRNGVATLATTLVEDGKLPVYPGVNPTFTAGDDNYVFKGWAYSKNQNDGTTLTAVTRDTTIYAAYTNMQAELITGGTTTQYQWANSAMNAAKGYQQATVRLLAYCGNNCRSINYVPTVDNAITTLDLNGHTWDCSSWCDGEPDNDYFLLVNKADAKLIITDNSEGKTGKLAFNLARKGQMFTVRVRRGELLLQGGTILANNTYAGEANGIAVATEGTSAKFTMIGGTLEATRPSDKSTGGTAAALYAYGPIDITGGRLYAHHDKGPAFGINTLSDSNNAAVNIGGSVVMDLSGAWSGYGLLGFGTFNIDGGTYNIHTIGGDAKGINMGYGGSGGQVTITGNPTFTVTGNTSSIYGIYNNNSAEVTVDGATFNVSSTGGGNVYGILNDNSGEVTVDNATFNVCSGGSSAANFKAQNSSTTTINGGTFDVTTTTAAEGVTFWEIENIRNEGSGAELNINGGTFTISNKTNAEAVYPIRCKGGTTNIKGNTSFTSSGYSIIGPDDCNINEVGYLNIDGGTFISKYGIESNSRTDGVKTRRMDITIWDGKFKSIADPINTGYITAGNLHLRGGYFSKESMTLDQISGYVVSPSTVETLSSGPEYEDGYTYHVLTKYSVTWSVGGVEKEQEYNRGEIPSYSSTPTIDDGNYYVFNGWSPAIAPVTADVTYTAQFTKYEAEVYEGESTTPVRFEHFTDAWSKAQNLPIATIKLISNVSLSTQVILNPDSAAGSKPLTLDLNNHTLQYTGSKDRFIYLEKTDGKLIIKDSSVGQNGQIKVDISRDAHAMAVALHKGTLELQSGTIYMRNTSSHTDATSWGVYPCQTSSFIMTDGHVQAYGKKKARGIYTESTGTPTVHVSGGTILASTEINSTWGNEAYGIHAMSGSTVTVSGTADITAHAYQNAYGVYAAGADGNPGQITVQGGFVKAIVEQKAVYGAYAAAYGKINIEGGAVDGHSNVANVTEMWNVEGAHCAGNGELNISGGDISSSKGASPIGVSVHGGTTTITGGKITSKTALHAVDYATATQTATVIVNGGTFIATDCAVRVYGLVRAIKDASNNVIGYAKNNANVTINGGYFYSEGSYIAQLRNDADATPSTLVLNGGKYCEKSGTTFKNQIDALKGSTTTINDINETVDGKTYSYQLMTKFNITWQGGSTYSKVDQIECGLVPSNNDLVGKSFVRNDSTFYFTGWSPTPTEVIGATTYNAVGDYHVASVKVGAAAPIIYDDFDEAWEYAMTQTSATITLLNNVTRTSTIVYTPEVANGRHTLNLNNFTITDNTSDRVLLVNKEDAKLTITDNSSAKGGRLYKKIANSTNIYGITVYRGEVIMAGGKIYCENEQDDTDWHPAIGLHNLMTDNAKITVTGGTVEAVAKTAAYGICSYGPVNVSNGTIRATVNKYSNARALSQQANTATITGGTFEGIGTGTGYFVYAVVADAWIGTTVSSVQNGTVNISGGTFNVDVENYAALCVQASASAKNIGGTNVTAHGTMTITGGTFNVRNPIDTVHALYAVYCQSARAFDDATPHRILAESKGVMNISGGTFTLDTRNDGAWVVNRGDIDLIRTWGTLNISGGTFSMWQNTGSAAINVYRGKTTISGNPVFNVRCNTGTARGIVAAPWNEAAYCDADMANNLAEIEVNGGTFNVINKGSGSTYGAFACGALDSDRKYAMSGKITINDGTFNTLCTQGADYWPILLMCDISKTGTYGTATANIVVNGGKFKSRSGTEESNTTHNATNAHTTGNIVLTGGYYETSGRLANIKADTCDVINITSAEIDPEYNNGYRYKIITRYEAKVRTGETERNFLTIKAALDYACTVANPTITLLNNCTLEGTGSYTFNPIPANWTGTLDLNNYKLTTPVSSDDGRAFTIGSSGRKLIITDNSEDKGGQIYYQGSTEKSINFIVIGNAEVELAGGTIYVENTHATAAVNGFVITGNDGRFTQTGGTFTIKANGAAKGYYGTGTVTLSGGTMNVTGGSSQVIGLFANETNSVLNISGTFALNASSSHADSYGVLVLGASASGSITGGKFTFNQNNIVSKQGGTFTISGGYFCEHPSVAGKYRAQIDNLNVSGTEVITLTSADPEYAAGYRYVVSNEAVAKVKTGSTTTYYRTIKAALDYAKTVANPTITLLNNCTLTDANYTIVPTPENWTGTLDLNNYTLTPTLASNGRAFTFSKAGCKLVITDNSGAKGGKMAYKGSFGSVPIIYFVVEHGEVKLEEGTLSVENTHATQQSIGFVILGTDGYYTQTGGTFDIKSNGAAKGYYGTGTVTLSGGTMNVTAVNADAQTIGLYANQANAVVNISGTFALNASSSAKDSYGVLITTGATGSITGGKFTFNQNNIVSRQGGTFTISGGYFCEHPDSTSLPYQPNSYRKQVNNLKASGKAVIALDEDDAMYIAGYRYIVTATPVAKVKSGSEVTYYTTPNAAFAYAKERDNAKIIMLSNCTITSALTWNPSSAITNIFDLNGKAISSTTSQLLTVNKGEATLTIKDTPGGGSMSCTLANSAASVHIQAGKLILQSGTISATVTSGSIVTVQVIPSGSDAAEFEMTGGKVVASATTDGYASYAILSKGATNASVTISGGEVSATSTGQYAFALTAANGGQITVEGTNNPKISATGATSATQVARNEGGEGTAIAIEGGLFKASHSGNPFNSTVSITGGYFNEYGSTTDYKTQIETRCVSPKHPIELTAAEQAALGEGGTDYKYKVVDAYTLTWTTDGDALTGDYTSGMTEVGATIIAPNTPTKANYVFAGWSPAVAGTMPAANTEYTATWTAAVASVQEGEGTPAYFATVAAAIEAANELTNPTVTMLQNASVDSEVEITAAMTIELNGKTVSSTIKTTQTGVFKINASGETVTIQDSGTGGKIDHTIGDVADRYVYGLNLVSGSLNITSGIIYAKNGRDVKSSNNRAYGIYAAASTVLTISGGTIEADRLTHTYAFGIESNGALTITGGTITAIGPDGYTYAVHEAAGSVNISGGRFSSYPREFKKVEGTAAITGGYYVHNTEDIQNNCATNYHVFDLAGESPYLYEVAEGYTLTWSTDGDPLTGTYTSGTTKVGTTIVAPSTPTKTGYTFAGWSPAVAATMPAENTTYEATWTVNSYTIRFLNYDGSVLQSSSVNYGETPVYSGETPSKPADATYTYTFTGWSPEIAAVSGVQDYTAQFSQTVNVASVTVGGETTYYTTLQDAFDYAADETTPTIQVLSDIELDAKVTYTNKSTTTVTFDLNGYQISGTKNALLTVSATSNAGIFIIKDSRTDGKISCSRNTNSSQYCVYAYQGTVELQSGTIYMTNTNTGADASAIGVYVRGSRRFTMTGGTVQVVSKKSACAVYSLGTTTISGGNINVTENKNGIAYGVHVQRGTTTIQGNPVFTVKATTGAYGVAASGTTPSASNQGYSGTIKVKGGIFNVETTSTTTAYGAYAFAGTGFSVTEEGGTVEKGNYIKAGIIQISGGVFNVKAKTTGAYGVYCENGTQTNAEAGDPATAYGKCTITGGKYKVQTTGDDDATAYAMNTVATAANLDVQGGYYSTKRTDASASSNIEDKYTAPTKTGNYYCLSATAADMASVGSDYNYKVAVAYTLTWNLDGGTVTTAGTGAPVDATGTPSIVWGVGDAITAPTIVRDGYTFAGWSPAVAATMLAANTTYTATWTPSDIGFHADIVDVDNSAKTLTLNVSMWGSSGWPYTINGVAYGKNSSSGQDKWREDDRTLILPYTGNAGDMFGIKVTAKNGTVVSDRLYIIPTAVTASANLGDQQVLYVKRGATLTVEADKTVKNIYVAPGAKLVISSGKTLTADTVFLRTEAWESAELENNGTVTAQICYTRIVKDESRYFQFGLPYDCPVSSVRLSSGHTIAYQGGWLLRSYSESSRAENGANGNNWQTLTDGTIQGCTGYEMFSAFGYYREFYFPVTPTDNTSVSVTRTGNNKAHSGWNIIVSPLMRAYACKAIPEGPVASWLTEDGSYWQRPIEEIKPAIPFSYQAKGSGDFSFGATMAAPAPRRVAATDEPTRIQWIQLEIADAEGNGDQAGIYSHPTRYDETYQTGIDVAKQSFEASRALLYTVHAYGDMAFAGVADSVLERGVPVTVYSPAGQELTFSLRENDWLDRLAEVWLIDNETGTRTDLLRDDYSFLSKAGTTAGRFVIMGRFYAPEVATGIHDVQSVDVQGAKAQKVLVDDKMYILINGRTYDATGKLVTNDNNK